MSELKDYEFHDYKQFFDFLDGQQALLRDDFLMREFYNSVQVIGNCSCNRQRRDEYLAIAKDKYRNLKKSLTDDTKEFIKKELEVDKIYLLEDGSVFFEF